MVLYEDTECAVCYQAFSRLERVPRVLHCRHTFCTPCLETMSRAAGVLLTVPCPMCRRVTCVQRCVGLQGSLWVNSALWDCIPDQEEQEDEEVAEEEEEEEVFRGKVDRLAPPHAEWEMRSWRRLATDDSL
ncbi:hypothetical protein CRUP_038046 [Coryphaenoides rupestris]|nr:hypothetical protein CRUP_038046 [Coryphaenoides rupestris]